MRLSLTLAAILLSQLVVCAGAQTKDADLTRQIQALDAKIEKEIGDLASRLEKVKDSPESKGRVAKVKKDFIADLQKSIALYRTERDKRIDKIGRPSAAGQTENLSTATSNLDARLDTRADQIVALTESFTQSDGYREYITVYDEDGMSSNDTRESPESVQKRREGSRASQTENDVVAGLKRSITDLDQRKAALTQRLASASKDEDRQALQAELDRIAAKRAERVQQIKDLQSNGADSGATTALSSKEAFALDKEVDALVDQLKIDFRELLRLANLREVERAKTR